jgi:uncharacterized membrane protein YeiB
MVVLSLMFGLLFSVFVYVLYILAIAFTLWMVVDASKQDRFWWVVLIVGVPLVGPCTYFFVEKKHEYAKVPIKHVHKSETEEEHERAPRNS